MLSFQSIRFQPRITMCWCFGKTFVFFERRPVLLHVSLIFVVVLYTFIGGAAFYFLEHDAQQRDYLDKLEAMREDFRSILQEGKRNQSITENQTIISLQDTALEHTLRLKRGGDSYAASVLYAFTTITTVGGAVAPITRSGRIFGIFYALVGIPMVMIIIANFGKYLNEAFCKLRERLEGKWKRKRKAKRRKRKPPDEYDDDEEEEPTEITGTILLAALLAYMVFGALVVPLLVDQSLDFIAGLYYIFVSLAAIDFSNIIPARIALIPISLLYLSVGLAIATIAIDLGSAYLKRLHHVGQKIKKSKFVKIWFGGKQLSVKKLVHTFGKKCDVPPEKLKGLDFDSLVETAIAEQEGKLPPQSVVVQSQTVEPLLPIDEDEDEDEPPPVPTAPKPFLASEETSMVSESTYPDVTPTPKFPALVALAARRFTKQMTCHPTQRITKSLENLTFHQKLKKTVEPVPESAPGEAKKKTNREKRFNVYREEWDRWNVGGSDESLKPPGPQRDMKRSMSAFELSQFSSNNTTPTADFSF